MFIEKRVKLKHQFQAVSLDMLDSTSFCADVEFFSGPKRRVRQREMGALVLSPSIDAHSLSQLIDLMGGACGGAPQ